MTYAVFVTDEQDSRPRKIWFGNLEHAVTWMREKAEEYSQAGRKIAVTLAIQGADHQLHLEQIEKSDSEGLISDGLETEVLRVLVEADDFISAREIARRIGLDFDLGDDDGDDSTPKPNAFIQKISGLIRRKGKSWGVLTEYKNLGKCNPVTTWKISTGVEVA